MSGLRIIPLALILFLTACSEDAAIVVPAPSGGVDGPPVTRSMAVLTADRYARAHWTMSSLNVTGAGCGGGFASVYPVGERIGVGYKWGGWDDIDTFLVRIAEGYGTGTGGYVEYDRYPFECVVGVSCTGLVSRAWHLDHKYTLNYDDPSIERKFGEITTPLSDGFDGLRRGDLLINEYHSMMFLYESSNHTPVIIDSSYEGVRMRAVTWMGLAGDGYVACRYNNIVEDDAPPGTIDDPIEIEPGAAAIVLEGNTRDAVSVAIAKYAIDPLLRMYGPENVYEVRIGGPGTLRASITQVTGEGIDNDLHLLSSLECDGAGTAQQCVARGDVSIEEHVEAGTWYLVVDSRAVSPGEYTLTVSFGPP